MRALSTRAIMYGSGRYCHDLTPLPLNERKRGNEGWWMKKRERAREIEMSANKRKTRVECLVWVDCQPLSPCNSRLDISLFDSLLFAWLRLHLDAFGFHATFSSSQVGKKTPTPHLHTPSPSLAPTSIKILSNDWYTLLVVLQLALALAHTLRRFGRTSPVPGLSSVPFPVLLVCCVVGVHDPIFTCFGGTAIASKCMHILVVLLRWTQRMNVCLIFFFYLCGKNTLPVIGDRERERERERVYEVLWTEQDWIHAFAMVQLQ
jgi:hypothetical protein